MKNVALAILLALLTASVLSGCAGWEKNGGTRVKCPACGYEFETPATGG